MTIDERTEKLAERHAAVAVSLDLMSDQIQAQKVLVNSVVEGIEGLVAVAKCHESRLSDFEG